LSSPVLRGPRPLVASFYGPWASEYEYEFGPQGLGAGSSPLGAVWRRALAGFMRRAQGRVLGRAARVIALSRHSAAELGQFGYNGSGKVKVIPGGVDLARFQQLERGARTGPAAVILSVRRLVPRMGLELLLDAHGLLRRRRGDIELRIVGEGALRAALEERAGALEGVRLLGRVDDAELAAQYAGADLVIMPTRALEGFGLPVVEAWACGTPVVATPVGSLPELVSRADRRFLAREASAEALAEAAGWALDEPRARWSERLRALAGSYSWSRIAAETRTTYQEALEDSGQP
jgi:glycosyltransferase involved in cell wall biosynthesis